jgi:hypothetical protein
VSKTAKIIIFSLIGVFVLCFGGIGGGILYLVSSTTKAPKAATVDFLTALEGGNNQTAYDLLCSATQAQYGREAFDTYVEKNRPAAHDLGWGGSWSNSNGTETATISATVTYKNGGSGSHEFELLKEGDAWKVCGDPF